MEDFFFFNDTATTEIYTLSLHDALPICKYNRCEADFGYREFVDAGDHTSERVLPGADRKSTRLNSSHLVISYAVFCLKKKKTGCAIRGVQDWTAVLVAPRVASYACDNTT